MPAWAGGRPAYADQDALRRRASHVATSFGGGNTLSENFISGSSPCSATAYSSPTTPQTRPRGRCAYLFFYLGLTPCDTTNASEAAVLGFVYDLRNYG